MSDQTTTALEMARMTCGQCGGPVTLEDPLDGGDPCLTCRPCGFLLAHVAPDDVDDQTGPPPLCGCGARHWSCPGPDDGDGA